MLFRVGSMATRVPVAAQRGLRMIANAIIARCEGEEWQGPYVVHGTEIAGKSAMSSAMLE